MVRSRGREVLYLPGGKVEPGESFRNAAIREGLEETGVHLRRDDLTEFATVVAEAHDQPEGTHVSMTLFIVGNDADGERPEPVPSAEVDALEWVTSAAADRCPPAGVDTLRMLVEADLID